MGADGDAGVYRCKGLKVESGSETVQIEIERGSPDGLELVFSNQVRSDLGLAGAFAFVRGGCALGFWGLGFGSNVRGLGLWVLASLTTTDPNPESDQRHL